MANCDGQASLRRQLVQLHLPESVANPIGTASISNNEQFFTGGIEVFSHALPPSSHTFYGKFGGLMVNAHIDEASVVDESIHAIGNGFSVCDGAVIRHINGRVLPFGLPFSPVVFERANEFFLLTVHRNLRLACRFKSFPAAIDLLKLGVSVGMYDSLT